MKLTLPYPPTLNNLKAVVRGRLITTKAAREYADTCQKLARLQGAKVLTGPVSVSVDVFRPRKAGDLDNTLKAAFDSLKGIAWEDDAQVVEIHARRMDDKHQPRIELRISLAGIEGTETET